MKTENRETAISVISAMPSSIGASQSKPRRSGSRYRRIRRDDQLSLDGMLTEKTLRASRSSIKTLYPDDGPLRRELYPKHLKFFAAGRTAQERCMMAANRVGKTFGVGGYETALHLTGLYPDWWEGHRFAAPIAAWAAGDTSETTRDIVQSAL